MIVEGSIAGIMDGCKYNQKGITNQENFHQCHRAAKDFDFEIIISCSETLPEIIFLITSGRQDFFKVVCLEPCANSIFYFDGIFHANTAE